MPKNVRYGLMVKVYFDASVIVSALISSTGGSAKLLGMVKERIITGITSQTVIDEVLEHTEKIKLSPRTIQTYITNSAILVRKKITQKDIDPYKNIVDAEDAHVLAGAHMTNCKYLVTLDKKHLLILQGKIKRIKIVNPKKLLAEV